VLAGKLGRETQLGDNIKMNLRRNREDEDWIHLAGDKGIQVAEKFCNFLTS
jgi:hypothetical protein